MKSKLFIAGLSIVLGWLWGKQRHHHPISLKGSVTIITGGASGIGKATAHTFARQGAIVIIADLAHQLTDTVRAEFAPYETRPQFIECDITQAEQRQSMLNEVVERYDRIDILINNAAVSRGGAFANLTSGDIEHMITVNLLSTVHLTHSVLNVMRDQNHGHIVNISSVNAMMPPPGEAIYAATKAGLNAFSDSLRRELGKTNINISVVMPALTQTGMLNNVSEEDLRNNQLLMPGMIVDKPDTVASKILRAVQYNKREIICGGQTTETLTWLARLRPSAMDWAFKYVINTEKFMNTLSELGRDNRE